MAQNDDDEEEVEYGMVMPFVACQSQGGAYEDDSFVAGYQAGQIDALLVALVPASAACTVVVPDALAEQIDLITMKHNYGSTVRDRRDGWSSITLHHPRARKPDDSAN